MLAIRATRLFDGERFLPTESTLLLEAGRIRAVTTGRAALPESVPVTDFGDATILPGLIDTHVHLVGDSQQGALDRVAGYSDAELDDVITEALRRQLAAGVTTVRDLGDRRWAVVERRDAQGRGNGDAHPEPVILASGPPVTSPGGHCFYMGGEVDGAGDIVAAVRARAERNVDVVKVMASGGMTTPGTDVMRTQFSDADLRLLVQTAHSQGLSVTAHAHGLPAVEQALAIGVDALEHCSCLTDKGVSISDELLGTLAARQVPVGAALTVPSIEQLEHAPPAMKAVMKRAGVTPEKFREMRLQVTGRMHRAGVRFVAGNDSGIAPPLAHGAIGNAIAFLNQAGATATEALAAATSAAADACGVGTNKGRLHEGYDADVVVVAGDLSSDVARLSDVCAVYLGGERV